MGNDSYRRTLPIRNGSRVVFAYILRGARPFTARERRKLRGDQTPLTVTSELDDNSAMIGIACFIKGSGSCKEWF